MKLTWRDVFLYGRKPEPEPCEVKVEPVPEEPEPEVEPEPMECPEAPRKMGTPASAMASTLQTMAGIVAETKKPVWADLPCFSC